MDEKQRPLRTIWQVSNELWNKIKSILDQHDPPNLIGRKRINARAALDAIILGTIEIACALLWYRRCWRLSNVN